MLLSPDTGAHTRGDVLMARLLQDDGRRVWALVGAPDEAGASASRFDQLGRVHPVLT